MIGRRVLPHKFKDWNNAWNAPLGWDGMFSHELNSRTREFEYPWAWHATPLEAGMEVVEIGGALSGFQFVLARSGMHVTNIDPGGPGGAGGSVHGPSDESVARLNRLYGTDVRLLRVPIEDAGLAENSVDRIFSISTLEHIPPDELPPLLNECRRILKPGGFLVLTVDLFLDLLPFSHTFSNQWGCNLNLRRITTHSRLQLCQGERRELHGFIEFDPRAIMGLLPELLIGEYPVVAQALVLRKPL